MKDMEALTMAAFVATVMAVFFPMSVLAATVDVGGPSGWDLATNFTFWSAITPIFANDTLSFKYTPQHDVIEVSEANFFTCDTSSPIAAYNDKDGVTLIELTQPGPRYFVCGRSGHCNLGLKLRINVLDTPLPPPYLSTTNSPANKTGDRTVSSDGPASNEQKEHTLDTSAGHKNAIFWEQAYVILTTSLFATVFVAELVSLLEFDVHPNISLMLSIIVLMTSILM